ncbi:iron-sulfur cluster insertion protein ErpA [Shigella flexneri]
MDNYIDITESAIKRLSTLLKDEEDKNTKLRIYITGGGCSGFQYGFTFDSSKSDDDLIIEKEKVSIIVDPMSMQYLIGSVLDFTEGLEGSRFVIKNPNAKITCGCGSSFGI